VWPIKGEGGPGIGIDCPKKGFVLDNVLEEAYNCLGVASGLYCWTWRMVESH